MQNTTKGAVKLPQTAFRISQQKNPQTALRALQKLQRSQTAFRISQQQNPQTALMTYQKQSLGESKSQLSLDDINPSLNDSKNNTNFVLTSHPTNLEFNFKDANGNPRKPTIYEENKHYHELLATNVVPENTEIWFGYDMDRHPEESPNVFPYAFLQNMRSSLLRNDIVDENHEIIKQCDAIADELEKAGNAKQVIDVKQELQRLAKDLQLIEKTNAAKFGLKAHYRISADDLESGEGIKKIRERLTELKSLQEIFGIMPVSQIIIADCNNSQQIDRMRALLNKVIPNSKINITPLVEENLSDDILKSIIAKADKTVMLAGSDSIQRDTYVGALIMKMKIQQLISEHNTNNPYDTKTFFEGAGSTINRNGRILPSRMGTILEGIEYMRTIQGQEAQQFIKNHSGHQDTTLNQANNSARCTIEDINSALPLFKEIYKDISKQQIALQKEPQYTDMLDREEICKLAMYNAHYGSRSKKPTSPETLNIKEQRAITQSMIHNAMGFQPEMMYWNTISDDMKNTIKANANNPLVKDFLNQYALLWQSCDLEESKKWIKDANLYSNFVQSYKAFQNFMGEIKAMPNCPKDLALNDLNDHSSRFGHKVYGKPSFNGLLQSSSMKSLLQINGAGFFTQQRPKTAQPKTFLEYLMEKERYEREKEKYERTF